MSRHRRDVIFAVFAFLSYLIVSISRDRLHMIFTIFLTLISFNDPNIRDFGFAKNDEIRPWR